MAANSEHEFEGRVSGELSGELTGEIFGDVTFISRKIRMT